MFEVAIALGFGLLLGLTFRGGVLFSALSTAGLIAACSAVFVLEWTANFAVLVLVWLVLSASGVALIRRFSRSRSINRHFLVGIALSGVQISVAATLVAGSLFAQGAASADGMRTAALYPAIAQAGAALPATSALAYPEPVKPEPSQQASAAARPIEWASVVRYDGTMARVLTGSVQAADRAPLAFETAGRVQSVLVDIGDSIERGDILATLDDTDYQRSVTERRAALVEAEARYTEARQTLSRQETLFVRNVVSEAVLEAAQAGMDAATSRLDVARTSIQQAEDSLADAVLRAPFDGSVAARFIEPAQTIQSGGPAFEVQGADGGFQIDVTVPEALVSQLSIGSEHRARLLDGTSAPLLLSIADIGARANAGTGFPVTLSVAASQGFIRSGMSAEVILMLISSDWAEIDAVAVPIGAILPGDSDNHFAFVYDEVSGLLARREVVLAGYEHDLALISKGLDEGDIVATRGLPFLRDGMAVALRGVGIARYDF